MRLYLIIVLFVFPFLLAAQRPYVQTNKMYLSTPQISAKSNLFQDSVLVEISLRHPGVIIRYSLKDSLVNEASPVYTQPLVLKESTMLRAKAFHADYLPSKTYSQFFYQINPFTETPAITCSPAPQQPYNSGGTIALLDKVKGGKDFRKDKSWLGFQGDTILFDLTFLEPTRLNHISLSVMQDQGSWIFMPQRAEVWSAGKMLAYTNIASAALPASKPNATLFISFDLKEAKEKNYLIKVVNLPALPDWHPGAGGTPWLFIDEIFESW